jgi:phosphonoacetaldehyde hydrolase
MNVLMPEVKRKGYAPDSAVCSTDVPAGRPFPWMCFQNAMNLGVFPLESMVKIGDTESDIQEGLNAGMWTIGLTRTGNELGLTEEEVESADPKHLRQKLAQIASRLTAAGAHFVAEDISACPPLIEKINDRLAHGDCP